MYKIYKNNLGTCIILIKNVIYCDLTNILSSNIAEVKIK